MGKSSDVLGAGPKDVQVRDVLSVAQKLFDLSALYLPCDMSVT